MPQILSLAYKKDGRETLKKYTKVWVEIKVNLMCVNNLDSDIFIDNLLIRGYGHQLQSQTPLNITMQDRTTRFQVT